MGLLADEGPVHCSICLEEELDDPVSTPCCRKYVVTFPPLPFAAKQSVVRLTSAHLGAGGRTVGHGKASWAGLGCGASGEARGLGAKAEGRHGGFNKVEP